MKRVLITQGCFSCCWVALTQSQELFCLSLHPSSEHAGGAQLGQPMPNGQRMLFFIPYHTVSCSACNTGERRSKRGHSEWRPLSSQVTSTCGGTLISWRWLNTCLSIRSDKWIPFLLCLYLSAKAAFALPIKLYFNPHVFPLVPFWSSSHPSRGERVGSWGAELLTGVKKWSYSMYDSKCVTSLAF